MGVFSGRGQERKNSSETNLQLHPLFLGSFLSAASPCFEIAVMQVGKASCVPRSYMEIQIQISPPNPAHQCEIVTLASLTIAKVRVKIVGDWC